jgi:hypothetical protein
MFSAERTGPVNKINIKRSVATLIISASEFTASALPVVAVGGSIREADRLICARFIGVFVSAHRFP